MHILFTAIINPWLMLFFSVVKIFYHLSYNNRLPSLNLLRASNMWGGLDNVVADALSRIKAASIHSVDFKALAQSQHEDAELRDLLNDGSSLHLNRVIIPGTNIKLYCYTPTYKTNPFATESIVEFLIFCIVLFTQAFM